MIPLPTHRPIGICVRFEAGKVLPVSISDVFVSFDLYTDFCLRGFCPANSAAAHIETLTACCTVLNKVEVRLSQTCSEVVRRLQNCNVKEEICRPLFCC